MSESSRPVPSGGADPSAAVLVFPDWSKAPAEPPRVPLAVSYERSLRAMAIAKRDPLFETQRLATKSRVEFVL